MNSEFLHLAYQFWKLAENTINSMEKSGNKVFIITDGDKSIKKAWGKADETFRWNANSIGIPVLFNFYHGLELFMKGFLSNAQILEDKSHILTSIYNDLKSSKSAPPKVLYVLKEILFSKKNNLYQFFSQNDSNVDDFYKLLKYPINNDGTIINYKLIRRVGMGSYKETYSLIQDYINKLYNSLLEYNCKDSEMLELLKK